MKLVKKSNLKTLDLHGYESNDVYGAVDQFIHKNQNAKRLRIMTGKGMGVVKKQVLDYLKKAHYPWQFETVGNGKKNEGVLIVILD